MYTNYATREIKKVCREIGPRASGTESERKAQEHFKGEMQTCADDVQLEEFEMHKYAFMGWVVIDGISMLLALLFSFLKMPVVSLVLAVIALVCLFA